MIMLIVTRVRTANPYPDLSFRRLLLDSGGTAAPAKNHISELGAVFVILLPTLASGEFSWLLRDPGTKACMTKELITEKGIHSHWE